MKLNEKQTVLVVDDTPENIDVLAGILRDDYHVKAATNGARALQITQSATPPDIILLDVMMPEMDGWQVCKRLKENYATRQIPVIFVTAKIDIKAEIMGLAIGAVDYITKPISPPIVQARVKTQLALYDQNRELEWKVRERTLQLQETRMQIVQRLGHAAEYKDNETGLHVIRMSNYASILGRCAGMSESEAELLLHAAPMHDIGKIGIPDAILCKPGKLDSDEWQIMMKHAEIGADILGQDQSDLLQLARLVALTHHEKWDGSGYPNSLVGKDIPLAGRIVAIADVFDALTSKRPYKEAWPVEKALEFLTDNAGSHFDPDLVPLFIDSMPQILQVRDRYLEVN